MPQWKQYSGIWTSTQQAQARAAETWTGIPRPELYAWGANDSGMLGLNDAIPRSSPVQVGALTDWQQVSAGDQNSFAIKTDGTLWGWGRPDDGVIGNNQAAIYASSPVQIGALTNWLQVSTAYRNVSAIKTDGTLWCWGDNTPSGAVGVGTVINKSSPVQIGSDTNWYQTSVGKDVVAAIKTDGTLWTWGASTSGVGGRSTTIQCSSPTQVGLLTNWSKVSAFNSFMHAIKTDGTLWSWGLGNLGQLGTGDVISRSSPVQVGADTDWANVDAGYFTSSAVKTDGTLWGWGYNFFGTIGDNTKVYRSSPVQVGALTTWSLASVGREQSMAIKTNGTLWTLGGGGTTGAAGQNNAIFYSSPIQIGALTSWSAVDCGQYYVLALDANPTT